MSFRPRSRRAGALRPAHTPGDLAAARLHDGRAEAAMGASGSTPKRVVVVGGGFAGLYAARALRRAAATVTLVDRRNHHLFQPLLYQVATAALDPSQIA